MGARPGRAVEGHNMQYRFEPFRWRDARAVAAWRYPGPYAFYNTSIVSLGIVALLQSLLSASGALTYCSVFGEREGRDELVGIFSFTRRAQSLEVGLGLRPDLTGQGIGLEFMEAGLAYARAHFRPQRFLLRVATFNKRAIRVYERAGFRPGRVYTVHRLGAPYEEMEMTRPAALDA